MINPDIFGYLATSLNLVMLLPQVIHTWKTKHTKGLSLTTLLMFTAGCVLWIIYGVAKTAYPVILANVVVGGMNIVLIFLKLRYKNE